MSWFYRDERRLFCRACGRPVSWRALLRRSCPSCRMFAAAINRCT